MERKKILLIGGLFVATLLVFTQVKKLGTPPAQTAQTFETQAPIIVETKMAQVLISSQTIFQLRNLA